MNNGKSVDIIIPVYNQLKLLKQCIKSILEYTDTKKHRIIVVNDNSSEIEMNEYLNELRYLENIIIINNDTNIGFSGSVNKGIVFSEENDVLLLNSDTIVTKNWLDKIIECAYSSDEIGIVNPLSNNATILTLKSFKEATEKGISIDAYADIVEKLSLKKFENIPVAIGFCMFIKRNLIKKIGLFDKEKFGKGYGEDNDFSYRAIDAGYTISLADNTFVWHYGGATFSEKEKKILTKLNKNYIDREYTNHIAKTNEFYLKNKISVFNECISKYIESKNGRKNILYYLHADFKENASNNVGGTQFHVKDIVESCKYKFNCYVVAKDLDSIILTQYIDDQVNEYRFFVDELHSPFTKNQKSYKRIIGSILDYFSIDCIHVHHTFGHTLDIFFEGEKRNIPIYLTLHDFYYICPKINLIDYEKNYCFNEFNIEKCSKCIHKSLNLKIKSLKIWHDSVKKIMNISSLIFVPSNSTKEIYTKVYDNIDYKIKVISHGIDIKNYNYKIDCNSKEFNIAFIGGINYIKGSELAKKIVLSCKDKNINYHIFGIIGDRELLCLEKPNLIKHGRYERSEISKLLKDNRINLVCILSQCPETFCYTLSESVASNIPVLVTDIGALGERVKGMNYGWTVDHKYNENYILDKIYSIKQDMEQYSKISTYLYEVKVKSIKEMIDEYIYYYDKEDKSELNRSLHVEQVKLIQTGYSLANLKTLDIDELFMDRFTNIENELKNIKSSILYKACLYFWNLNIPFRDNIKSIAKKVYIIISKFKM